MSTHMENEARYDDLFGAILQQEGKMEPFFDHIFNFLFRRTDFYITMKTTTDKMGFPPGKAEMMVREAFKKYETKAKANELRNQQPNRRKKEELRKQPPGSSTTSDTDSYPKKDKSTSISHQTQDNDVKSSQPPTRDDTTKPPQVDREESQAGMNQYDSTGDTFNGGVTDKYRWSQSLTELDVLVPLPPDTKAKNVSVQIKNTHLRIAVAQSDQELVLIDGGLPHKVLTDSSLWMVESGCVHVSLDKAQERMWGCVIEGEKEIDLTKVEAVRDMSELDSESHAAVNRVMFDQHQKMQGKPQSHELQTYEVLEKAWDAEGSPFKGTPFDPSKVNISNSRNNI